MSGENSIAPKLTHRTDQHFMPWHIAAGKDGLLRDAILVAKMDGSEMLSISLHVATTARPEEASRDTV